MPGREKKKKRKRRNSGAIWWLLGTALLARTLASPQQGEHLEPSKTQTQLWWLKKKLV